MIYCTRCNLVFFIVMDTVLYIETYKLYILMCFGIYGTGIPKTNILTPPPPNCMIPQYFKISARFSRPPCYFSLTLAKFMLEIPRRVKIFWRTAKSLQSTKNWTLQTEMIPQYFQKDIGQNSEVPWPSTLMSFNNNYEFITYLLHLKSEICGCLTSISMSQFVNVSHRFLSSILLKARHWLMLNTIWRQIKF